MTDRPRGAEGADARRVLAETRAWVERAVIGLNLCPFARAVEAKGRIRYVHFESTDPEALLERLREEMRRLAAADLATHETTLIVHPHVLQDFLDYNDFLDRAEDALDALGYAGTLQIASFHPHYQFAGTAPDDPGNATNRSPYPTLHLLREDSVERAVAAFPEAEAIYERNIETMERLGAAGWAALRQACREDARRALEEDAD
jgi:hypothetical protein